MKVYTLNSFAQNNETGFFDDYYDNHGVFIMEHFAEQFSHQHNLEHKELFGETLRYVIEEFENMIIRFLKKLFCFHDYEQEESLTTNEYFEVCKKCNKVRKIKVLFGSI